MAITTNLFLLAYPSFKPCLRLVFHIQSTLRLSAIGLGESSRVLLAAVLERVSLAEDFEIRNNERP